MVLTYIKSEQAQCASTGVYVRHIINTTFSVLHWTCEPSECLLFFSCLDRCMGNSWQITYFEKKEKKLKNWPFLKKRMVSFFLFVFCCWHHSSKTFQTLHDYNLAWGLAVHTRFDDLDLISRSQVCQNHKLQIVFRFLSTVGGCTH